VLVGVVKWRRVAPWRSRIVLRLAQLPRSASIADHQRAISRLGRRRDCLGEFGYIAEVLFVVWSTSDIERGSVPPSLLLVHMHTGPCLQR
jgi:hypothetical protein